MFKTVKRIINWCGNFKSKLFLGFVFSFFSTWFAAAPIFIAALTIGKIIDDSKGLSEFDTNWIWLSIVLIFALILLRFLFDYLRAKHQESISYELVARDRLAIGNILKRVSLGYFQKVNIGDILNSITTGLHSLETMGIRMVDNFVSGYLNCLCIFIWLAYYNPFVALIAIVGVIISYFFLQLISRHSKNNASIATKANRDLTNATIEYARGLSIVKSFGQSGASVSAMKKACADSKNINLQIEWGFVPSNCCHQFALKLASIGIVIATCFLGLNGDMPLSIMLVFCFFSFTIFSGIEPISDSAHVLGIIDDALSQLNRLEKEDYIDENGKDVSINNYNIDFNNVTFGYDDREIIKNATFSIPEFSSTAIVGPSGCGKTTLCNLIARFYDVNSGSIKIGNHNVKEFTCDSLLSNISMVFQNVYLFNDTIKKNISFGKPDATNEEIIAAAKKACCHDFIMALPNGYDTVVGEGGGTLSGGEKQRISIARAILKDSPIIILDEATASIDPENEHLIQSAITELTQGKTIITIAHRLATIVNSDQIIVIDKGKIAEKGTHEELLAQKGIYSNFIAIREAAEGWSI